MDGLGIAAAAGAEETSREIVKGVSSILSIPSAEVGNYLADKIRFLRFKSLLKILSKAEALCKAENARLKTPALKFLVPFAEGASLEEENDADVQLLWANLLKSSARLDVGDSLMFVHFLKSVGRREVEFLSELVEQGRATTFAIFMSFHNAEDSEWLDEHSFQRLVDELPSNFDYSLLAKLIVDVSECTGVLFYEVVLLGTIEGEIDELCSDHDWGVRKRREKPARVLESLGILERFDFKHMDVSEAGLGSELFVKGYRITPAGIAFYEACTGRDFKHSFKFDFDLDEWLKRAADQ